MARCCGTTKANKPCKRLACAGAFCLAHIPAPSADEIASVQRAVLISRELLKLKVDVHPFLLKGVTKETYYNQLIAFNVMTRQVGNLLGQVRPIVDRMDTADKLAAEVSNLTTAYAQALWFADDLVNGYNVLVESAN